MRGDIENEDTLNKVRTLLDQSVDQLPRDVLSSLKKRRARAVELAEKREARFWGFPEWLTTGRVASIAILVVAVSLWISPVGNQLTGVPGDDLEVVAINEQLELYEDLEFFMWLSEKENAR